MQKAALTKLSVGVIYGRLKERDLTLPHRCDASVIDGRWKGTILWRLLDGPMRQTNCGRVFLKLQRGCFSVIYGI